MKISDDHDYLNATILGFVGSVILTFALIAFVDPAFALVAFVIGGLLISKPFWWPIVQHLRGHD